MRALNDLGAGGFNSRIIFLCPPRRKSIGQLVCPDLSEKLGRTFLLLETVEVLLIQFLAEIIKENC